MELAFKKRSKAGKTSVNRVSLFISLNRLNSAARSRFELALMYLCAVVNEVTNLEKRVGA